MSAERFLVIQLRQIGDVVLTTPLPQILNEARPKCRVAFLTEKPSDQLLASNPYIDEVILNDRKGTWRDTLRLAQEPPAAGRPRQAPRLLRVVGSLPRDQAGGEEGEARPEGDEQGTVAVPADLQVGGRASGPVLAP